jgi:hypothetical protein
MQVGYVVLADVHFVERRTYCWGGFGIVRPMLADVLDPLDREAEGGARGTAH